MEDEYIVDNSNYYDSNSTLRELEQPKELKTAKHYVRQGTSTYGFVDDVIEKIPAAFYRPLWDAYNMKSYLVKRDIIVPKLYHLPDDVFERIMNDIQNFWENEDKYRAFGNVYKKNILLYSIPGNGKTSLINMLSSELITKYEGIIITINEMADLIAYPKAIEHVRQIEPNRKIITIIEDFDGLACLDNNAETMLLQILDGNNQYDNVVTIATTNYIDKLKPSFTNRPSRFNVILEYKKPNEKVRRFYYTNKLKDSGFDISDEKIIDSIERLVKASEDYTFDYCKELLELIYIDGCEENKAIERLNSAINKKGNYKITEDKPTIIGFGD